MTEAVRIDIDDPDVDMDMGQRLLYQGELFTGEAVEYFGQQVVALDEYVDGLPNGRSRAWYPDGTLRSEGRNQDGRPMGEFKRWHPNGVLQQRRVFDGSVASLAEEDKWDDKGNLLSSWRREAGTLP
ncbi:hypothetical protein ABZ826_11265 [Streptomyces sp. NPDC047515]